MSDDRSTFEVTRARLDDIVKQVQRKDVSLEQSLDLFEEAVRLANQCNDLIDQTSFKPSVTDETDAGTDIAAAETGEEPMQDRVSEAVAVVIVEEVSIEAIAADAEDANDEAADDDADDTFAALGEVTFEIEDDERV